MQPVEPVAAERRQRRPRPARFWYLAGMCPYFGALGIQNVVIIWLMTQVLHESPSRVGLAQMLTMLPMLTLVLLGGVAADRRELRRLLVTLQSAMALLPLGLAWIIYARLLSYPALLLISVSIGVLGAFIVPARDAMLSVVDDGEIQRTVTAMTGLQFASQIAGLILGGAASWLAVMLGEGPSDPAGAAGLLILQSGLIFGAAMISRKLPVTSKPPPLAGDPQSAVKGIWQGFVVAKAEAAIWPILVLLFCIGTLFTGVFLVQIPLLARDVYQGGSDTLAGLNISFMAGTTLTVLALRRFRPIIHQGRALLLASGISGFVIAMIALAPALPLMYLLAAVWGGSGGIVMIMSRSLVQGAAPEASRGRILSIFQLAYVGGAPLGCFAMGLLIDAVGVVNAALAPAAGMAAILAVACRASNIWRLPVNTLLRHDI